MAEAKTIANDEDVEAFLQSVENKTRREDARKVMAMMADATGAPPVMWGPSIIGYGSYHYKYDSGHEGDCHRIGVSPRKAKLSVYIMPGFKDFSEELSQLGPHKTGASCLYLGSLAKVDLDVLQRIIDKAVAKMNEMYPSGA